MGSTSRFIGVGVGPGDPELLTARALRVLKEAGRVFAPTMAVDLEGRAEWIVARALPELVMERLAINLDPAAREAAYREAAGRVAAALDEVGDVAFVTLGDPNVYSTFGYLARTVSALRPAVAVETVPGIMAFQDLAARSGTVVLEGAERLVLVSAAAGPEVLEAALADPEAAIVVYKGGSHLPAVARRLAAAGRAEGAVVGELLGLPGERVGALAPDTPEAGYLATVIVPPAGRPAGGRWGVAPAGGRGGTS
jgi:precorrin-2/cobalt-factor-2 C20-methyltransferase